jgi:hypothetical protein
VGVFAFADTVSMSVADPPDGRLTLFWLNVAVGLCFTTGERVAVRVMVAENPPTLDIVMVEVAEEPTGRIRDEGLTITANETELLKVAVWRFSGTAGADPLAIVTQKLSLLVFVQPVWYPMVMPDVVANTL